MTDTLFAVWSPASVITAIVGGVGFGAFVIARFDGHSYTAGEMLLIVAGLGAIGGSVFWLAQAIETLVSDGPVLAWRVVSRFALWLLFVSCAGIGTALGHRR